MRHENLSTIASFWRIVAFLMLIGGAGGALLLALSDQIVIGIFSGVGACIGCLACFTIAGVIDVLTDTEYHLRSINPKMQQRANGKTGQRTRQKQEI